MSELIKTCNKCNLGKDAGTCFDKRLNSRDGYRQTCKTCRSEQSRGYRGRNKERTVIDVPLEKICLKCGEKKDNALFYKNKGKTDGLGSYCKICSDKSIKSWGDKNRVRKTRGQNRWPRLIKRAFWQVNSSGTKLIQGMTQTGEKETLKP